MIKGGWDYSNYGLYFCEENKPKHAYIASITCDENRGWYLCKYVDCTSLDTLFDCQLSDFVQDLENPTIEEITLLELEAGLPVEDMFDKLKEIL